MAVWDQYIYGDGQKAFSDTMTSRPYELEVVGNGLGIWADTGRPTYFAIEGTNLSASGNPAQLNDGGTVTRFSSHVYNLYPAVEISGVSLTTAYFKANILAGGAGASGTAATFRAFVNSQSWTFNGSPGGDTFTAGEKSDKLFGYSGDDTLYGLNGSDKLDGGSGKDKLYGGTGDDTYYVDTDLDQVREAAGEGYDRVYASASFTLHASLAEVEYLATTDEAGTHSFRLTGSDQANTVRGNAGFNIIMGRGGADVLVGLGGNDRLDGGKGNDTLTGGSGSDTFLFSTALGSTNIDAIKDFTNTGGEHDRIGLSKSLFAALGDSVTTSEFYAVTKGHAAHDASDNLIYNKTDGALWYDADGTGKSAAVQIATLTNKAAIDYHDFFLA